MKLLILSDIHANATALKNILEKEKDADKIVCAGDCVDFGLEAHEAIELLKKHNVLTVMGNHDLHLLSLYDRRNEIRRKDDSEIRTFGEYNIKYMTDEDFDFLSALPEVVRFTFDGCDYLMKHSFDPGHYDYMARHLASLTLLDYFSHIRKTYTDLSPEAPLSIINGHTHSAMINMVADGKFWLNPGSVSYRKGDDHKNKGSDYLVIEDGAFRFRHLACDSAWMAEKTDALPSLEEENRRAGHSFWDPEVLPD